jgi:hypothetical protein
MQKDSYVLLAVPPVVADPSPDPCFRGSSHRARRRRNRRNDRISGHRGGRTDERRSIHRWPSRWQLDTVEACAPICSRCACLGARRDAFGADSDFPIDPRDGKYAGGTSSVTVLGAQLAGHVLAGRLGGQPPIGRVRRPHGVELAGARRRAQLERRVGRRLRPGVAVHAGRALRPGVRGLLRSHRLERPDPGQPWPHGHLRLTGHGRAQRQLPGRLQPALGDRLP